jgi:hypothetical protein
MTPVRPINIFSQGSRGAEESLQPLAENLASGKVVLSLMKIPGVHAPDCRPEKALCGKGASSKTETLPKIVERGKQLPRETEKNNSSARPAGRSKSEYCVHSLCRAIKCKRAMAILLEKTEHLLPAWMRVLRHQQHGCFANTSFRCLLAVFEMPVTD